MDGAGTSSVPPLELLVLQPTSFCNLDCLYCYVPGRSDKRKMQLTVLEQLINVIRFSPRLPRNKHLEVLWHAGEPLAAGVTFFRAADRILDVLSPEVQLRRTIQTNATLIDDAWCEYFHERGVQVGISVDGPKHLHDDMRRDRRGRGSFVAVQRGINKLRDANLDLNGLAVLTPRSIDQPDAMFEYFFSEGFGRVGFNVEEIEGTNSSSEMNTSIASSEAFMRFMDRFMTLNEQHDRPLSIREVHATLFHLRNRQLDRCYVPDQAELEAGRIVTVSRDGAISTWSPELASGTTDNPEFFSLGNVFDIKLLDEAFETGKAIRIQKEINRGRRACEKSCQYASVCGAGSPANRFYETGSFEATHTIKCTHHTKAMVELLLTRAAHKPDT